MVKGTSRADAINVTQAGNKLTAVVRKISG